MLSWSKNKENINSHFIIMKYCFLFYRQVNAMSIIKSNNYLLDSSVSYDILTKEDTDQAVQIYSPVRGVALVSMDSPGSINV